MQNIKNDARMPSSILMYKPVSALSLESIRHWILEMFMTLCCKNKLELSFSASILTQNHSRLRQT